jgi:hypothetical protein
VLSVSGRKREEHAEGKCAVLSVPKHECVYMGEHVHKENPGDKMMILMSTR